MNWSSAELTATELAKFAADKPLIGANVMSSDTISAARWSEDVSMAGDDRSLAAYPIARMYDGKPNLVSYGYKASNAADTWRLQFDFGSGGAPDFDFFCILGHNIYSHNSDSNVTVYCEVDDAADFGTSSRISTSTVSSDDRVSDWTLYHTGSTARRYSDVRYLMFQFIFGAPQDYSPQISEIVLGTRCQMYHLPDQPYSDDYMDASESRSTTISGVTSVLGNYRYQKRLDASFTVTDSTLLTNIRNWYRYVNAGSRSFVYLPFGNDNTDQWYLMTLDDPALRLPSMPGSYAARSFQLNASEQGPETNFYYYETIT